MIFEKGRIVATMAVHLNYNWKKIVYDPIKKGNEKTFRDHGSVLKRAFHQPYALNQAL